MKSLALLTWFVATILQWSAIVFSYCFFLSDLIARAPFRQQYILLLVFFLRYLTRHSAII